MYSLERDKTNLNSSSLILQILSALERQCRLTEGEEVNITDIHDDWKTIEAFEGANMLSHSKAYKVIFADLYRRF